jgi:hypothetical protein
MGSLIKTIFIATGAHEGKTVRLGRDPWFQLVEGKLEAVEIPEDMGKLAHFLEVNWQIFPEGSKALRKAQEANGQRDLSLESTQPDGQTDLSGDRQPEGLESSPGEPGDEDREGNAEAGGGDEEFEASEPDGPAPELNAKLQRAVLGLDTEVDENWTAGGLPAISAVTAAYGSEGVTRADIAAVAPGFTRAQARKVAQ